MFYYTVSNVVASAFREAISHETEGLLRSPPGAHFAKLDFIHLNIRLRANLPVKIEFSNFAKGFPNF